MNFYEIFNSEALAAYWVNINANIPSPIIGTRFFPLAKQTGLELSWIKGYNNLPIALQPSGFDTKASLRDRIGVTELQTSMPFFREAMRIGEKDRQNIETLLAKNQKFAEPTIMRIFDDVNNLINGAIVQQERLRMSVLTTGAINISADPNNGRKVPYVYNYDVSGEWATKNNKALQTTAKWTVANSTTSDPIVDIQDAIQLMSETYGVLITEVIMNSTTYKGLLASDSIAKAINPLGASNIILKRSDVEAFVKDETKAAFTIYDKMYKDEQGKDKKYLPDGYVILVPSYPLGNTWFGTTPEEFDLMNGNTGGANTSIVNTGVAVTTIKEAHPVNIQTIVSEIVLPSFERMDDVYVIKVF